jgi:PAS domain S-box-containing protein
MKTTSSPQNHGHPGEYEGRSTASRSAAPTTPNGSEGLQVVLATPVQRYGLLADNVPDVVYSLDESGTITAVNKAITLYGYTAGELLGKRIIDLVHIEDRDRVAADYFKMITKRVSCSHTQQFRIISGSGTIHWLEANCSIEFGPRGRFVFYEGVCRDITESMQNKNMADKIREELEELINIRTTELIQANEELQREILERRETERVLREREADLQMEKGNLQETNTALKVLLKRREVDKYEFEEQVMCNVKEFVLPYLDKLKNLKLDERLQAYLSILESNLSDITSSFSKHLSVDYYDLTPSERKTANFIRQGKKTREIASLLGISHRTVEAFRLSIRKKLRLQNKKVNLRTFLQSIDSPPHDDL